MSGTIPVRGLTRFIHLNADRAAGIQRFYRKWARVKDRSKLSWEYSLQTKIIFNASNLPVKNSDPRSHPAHPAARNL
jgi:hypothetical protein